MMNRHLDEVHEHSSGDDRTFLGGGDEMSRLIASKDWSATPLGPIARWPRTLRTTMGLCLATKFPISLTWGPSNVTVYNDSYLPICGDKHPHSLGQDFSEIWAAAWPWLGEPFARALAGEPAFLENQRIFLDRHGYLEETFFTFSFSPVRDESGAVCGVFNPAAETTLPNLDQRRTRALRDVTASTATAESTDEVLKLAAETLARYDLDLPFVLFFALDGDGEGERARVLASTGLAPSAASWPIADVVRSRQAIILDDVQARLGGLRCGPYPESPRRAVLLPLSDPGSDHPFGALVAGVSSRLALDESYRAFYDLLAGALNAAFANARAHEEERRRAEALAAIDRAKTAFFSNVSHEFRTPLTLLLGPTEDALALRDRALRGTELETVHRNALRLLKLVNTLLDFARIEEGRAEASYEPMDLAALTRDLASIFRSAMHRAGLAFEVDCAPLREPVYVDRDMWEKIVLNLVSNALKFTFEGGVRVTLLDRGKHVELEVADTGVGISESELPKIFERFRRVEGARSRTHEGSGIGLALVNDLVRLHGGELRAESTVGSGTSFTVTLPFGKAHLPASRIGARRSLHPTTARAESYLSEALRWLPQPAVEQPPAADPSARARVLVADDNADMRDYVARLLGQRWTVETAADGVEALERVRANPPDLVLADVMMPNLDGFGLLRELRGDPRTAGIPVVMLSARSGEESRIEGLDAGADDYLVKPFSARELMARVQSQIALADAARERALLVERADTARRDAELQKQHVASLLMQAPTPICVLRGRDYVVELANPDVCRMWGRTSEQLLGRPLLEALPELRSQAFTALLDNVMDTGKPHTGREIVVALDRRGDGKLENVYLNFASTPLHDVHGGRDGVLVIASDVSVAVRAREEMTRLRDLAESANHGKDEFLAMLGHELRNPLGPLQLAARFIRKRLPSSVIDRQLDVIERQTKNLTRIVDDLLEASRITHGKIELHAQRVDLAKAVSLALESTRELLDARKHEVSVSLPMHPVFVRADPVRLDQIVINLVNNAAKYTDVGGRIWVVLESQHGNAVLRVRDNGIGIPEDLKARIFEVFQQGNHGLARAQGGLGIGLSIVRRLVELHGGDVEVRSEGAGQGSEFLVRLPIAGDHARATAASQPPEEEVEERGERLRVLVVDDNRDAAECLAALISDLGHETQTALDAPSALRMAEEWLPELMFLDIGLPLMDGYEVARELRRRNAAPVLIALTGYGQESDRRKAIEAGFDQHVVKPPQLDTIEAIISRVSTRAGASGPSPLAPATR